MRDDDRNAREANRRRRQSQRIAAAQIEDAGQPQPDAGPDRQIAAVGEDRAAMLAGHLEQRPHMLTVEPVAV